MSAEHFSNLHISTQKKCPTSHASQKTRSIRFSDVGNLYHNNSGIFTLKQEKTNQHEGSIAQVIKELLKQAKKICKSVSTFLLRSKDTSSRRTCTSVKSTCSSSSSGNDPDPEPKSEHYSLSIYFFKLITTLLILISVISFVATSTYEVTE